MSKGHSGRNESSDSTIFVKQHNLVVKNLCGLERKRKAGKSDLGFCLKPLGDTI